MDEWEDNAKNLWWWWQSFNLSRRSHNEKKSTENDYKVDIQQLSRFTTPDEISIAEAYIRKYARILTYFFLNKMRSWWPQKEENTMIDRRKAASLCELFIILLYLWN